MSKNAVDLMPKDHPDRAAHLNTIALSLLERAKLTSSTDDLNEAIEGSTEGVKLCLEADMARAGYLNTLGCCLQTRSLQTRSSGDREAAVEAYRKALDVDLGLPVTRITSAIEGASLLFPQSINKASQLLTKALELLPKATPRSLLRHEQQGEFSFYSGLAGDAAALSIRANGSVSEAVRLLELGRGLMAGVSFDSRSDITALERSHPGVAERFKYLLDQLDVANLYAGENWTLPETQRTLRSQTARRYKASTEFDEMLEAIRSESGFERFLLGPSGDEMKKIARDGDGPVVILNCSHFGSDAFLITHNDLQRVPLEKLSFEKVEDQAQKLRKLIKEDSAITRRASNKGLREILESLWDDIVNPVLEALGFEKTPTGNESWPHVKWIPVGLLNLFPTHAAGYHFIAGRQTLDRVISSYSPTLRALSQARSQMQRLDMSSRVDLRTPRVLLASMQETPNRAALPHAAAEAAAVEKVLPLEKTILPQATTAAVLQALQDCSVVHLACHGETHPDPSQSRLFFTDWESDPLFVADMARLTLGHVQMAYLSACHGAGSENLKLLDEAIHMAGACQLAGFPAVIGSLWQVMDQYSAKVAARVYETMLCQCSEASASGIGGARGEFPRLDIRKAALGLHLAVREVRGATPGQLGRKKFSDPMAWAPYIYVGI